MPEDTKIFVSCSTHSKLYKPRSITISHRHEYTPPAVEAEIIQNYEKSTARFRTKLRKVFSYNEEFGAKIEDFLTNRQKLLEKLKETPEVASFLLYVLGLEAEVETELELEKEEFALQKLLGEDVEEKEEESAESNGIGSSDEVKTRVGGKKYDNLLDAISDAIREEKKESNGKSRLQETIQQYANSYLNLIEWLVDQRHKIDKHGISMQQLQQLIAEIISCDVLLIANDETKLGSEESLVIPLDISPVRIFLALLFSGRPPAKKRNWNRMFSPPVFLTWKDNIARLVKPYRSLDKHPIMIRIPMYDKDSIRFQEDAERSLKHFQKTADPLIEKLKGLTPFGKRGTTPSLIKKHLYCIMSAYLDYNPFSIEKLRVMDLGCASGKLLKDSFQTLLKNRSELRERIMLFALLNDLAHDPGRLIRRASKSEDFARRLKLEVREGDMRELVVDAYGNNEHYDIVFINRVLDIYGGYGIFTFSRNTITECNPLQITVETQELAPYEFEKKVVVFSRYEAFDSFWRAIAFLLEQRVERDDKTLFLPAVLMDAFTNFFAFKEYKGFDLFSKLLDVAELLVISIFPGSFQSVFPIDSDRESTIFFHEVNEANTYSIIFASKNRCLIDFIKSAIQ